MELAALIKVARGDEPADLLLKNAKVINVFTGDIQESHIAVVHSRIAGLGDYEAHEVVDLDGRYVCPGFIDLHVHFRDPGYPDRENFQTGNGP